MNVWTDLGRIDIFCFRPDFTGKKILFRLGHTPRLTMDLVISGYLFIISSLDTFDSDDDDDRDCGGDDDDDDDEDDDDDDDDDDSGCSLIMRMVTMMWRAR